MMNPAANGERWVSLMLNPSYACRLDFDFPSVIPADAGIQVADSVRHTVEERYPDDDSAGMTEF